MKEYYEDIKSNAQLPETWKLFNIKAYRESKPLENSSSTTHTFTDKNHFENKI